MTRPLALLLALAGAAAAAAPALAGPMATDLGALAIPADLLSGPTVSRADEPGHLLLACLECGDGSAVDLAVAPGAGDRGTEARVRSGETTAADLQALCQQREPACTVELLDVPPAVGWISAWTLGATSVATAIVLRDGDQLTLRSIGPDPARARANADAVIATLVPQIVGP